MKKITFITALLWLCGFSPHRAAAQDSVSYQVDALHYFFDQDPGFGVAGNGAVIPVSPADSVSQLLNVVVPSNFSDGVHHLIVRARDTSGHWSLVQRRALYVSSGGSVPAPALAGNLQAVQYFFDQDLGFGVAGNGAVIPVPPDDSIAPIFNIIVPASLGDGVHQLVVRVQDVNGEWSLVQRKAFYISRGGSVAPPDLAGNIVAVQYFYNNDPGFGMAGNGAVLPVSPSDSVLQNLSIVLPPSLPLGVNHLIVRVQDQFGNWSLIDRRAFYLSDGNVLGPPEVSGPLTALEYFYDIDPGVGMANRIDIPATDTAAGLYSIQTPCLVSGQHVLYVRARNADGDWSLVAQDTLDVLSGTNIQTAIAAADTTAICPGDSVKLLFAEVAGASYQWLRDGAPIAGADTCCYFASQPGDYQVRTTCNGAFTISDTIAVNFLPITKYFADKDGDGFGDPNDTLSDCSPPAGFVLDSLDCDDSDSTIHPNAAEICDGIDNNCDGQIDENLFQTGISSPVICQGDSVFAEGDFQFQSGTFIDTLVKSNACDSIIVTNLTVNPSDTTFQTQTTADSTMAGVVDSLFTNQFGCDSLLRTTVIFDAGPCPTIDTTVSTVATCDPNASTGVTFITLTGSDGCDSVLQQITFFVPPTVIGIGSHTICQGDSLLIFGAFRSVSGVFADSLQNRFGCDSVVLRTLTVAPVFNDSTTVQICAGDSALIFGNFETTAGFFTDSNQTAAGCDSLSTIELQVVPSISSKDTLTICQGDSVSVFGNFETAAGVFNDTSVSAGGCDSIATICLVVNNVDTNFITTATCDSAAAGSFTSIFTDANGCDSLVITTVVLQPSFNDTLFAVEICDGDSTLIFGNFETAAGFFTDSNQTAAGCDSISIRELKVKPVFNDSNVAQICQGDSVLIFGIFRKTAGFITDFGLSSSGCDSNVAFEIVVVPRIITQDTLTICQGDSVSIFGNIETAAGTFVDTSVSSGNCDSIATIQLVVNDTDFVSVVDSICSGDSLFLGGNFQTAAGIYTDVFQNQNGCDSTVTTVLTVRTDSACLDTVPRGDGCNTVVVSDNLFKESNVVGATNNSGNWNGVNGNLPPTASYGMQATEGQPYNFNSIGAIDSAQVLKAGNAIRFFRKEFILENSTDVEARVRINMDDQAEIYVNGILLAADYSFGSSTWKNPPLDAQFRADGTVENPSNGGEMFDFATAMDLDNIFQTGSNEVVVVVRNLAKASDRGGFTFRMDVRCADSAVATFADSCVADTSWRKSTVITPTGNSGTWSGTKGLPDDSTFTLPVEIGQPYSFASIEAVDGSQVIKSENNIRYFRKTFELSENQDVRARFRSTFDDQVEIYVNGTKLLRENSIGRANWKLPPHDILFMENGTAANGNAGGQMFDFVGATDLDTVFRRGQNTLTVALRNFGKSTDRGGFSFRLDVSKGGSSVLLRKESQAAAAFAERDALTIEVFPNPTNGKLTLLLPLLSEAESAMLILTDLNGRALHKIRRTAGDVPILELDLAAQADGIYFLRYRHSGEMVVKKIVKR